MTQDDVKRLEAIQSTIATDGWKHLVEDIEAKIAAMKEEFLNPSVTIEMLRFGQGRIAVYKEFLSLGTIVDQILQDHIDDQKEESLLDV